MSIPDPERPTGPDEPVDPDQKPVPERDRGTPEDYRVPDPDPEAVVDEPDGVPATGAAGADDPDEQYPRMQDVEEDRA